MRSALFIWRVPATTAGKLAPVLEAGMEQAGGAQPAISVAARIRRTVRTHRATPALMPKGGGRIQSLAPNAPLIVLGPTRASQRELTTRLMNGDGSAALQSLRKPDDVPVRQPNSHGCLRDQLSPAFPFHEADAFLVEARSR